MQNCSIHISSILAKLMVRWKTSNPEALRQMKRVSDMDGKFLELEGKEKTEKVDLYRNNNFRLSNGQTINLVKLEQDALAKESCFVDKKKVLSERKE